LLSDKIYSMRKQIPCLFIFLFTLSTLWGQSVVRFGREQVYDPFYDMEVELADGDIINLTAAAFHNIEDEEKYFFWIRRGTESGIVTYALELNRIKEIRFTDVYGKPENDYTPATLVLTNGQSYEIFMDTLGYLGGFDEAFGSYGRIFMHYNLVKRITLKQDGTYRLCPHCGTVFYSESVVVCPFDKTPLTDQE
jgi:hypothetical protein